MRLDGEGAADETACRKGAGGAQARVVEADLFFLSAAGALFVDTTAQRAGLKALGFTATNPAEWFFLQSFGLDGLYTDDIPFGVQHQAPIP